MYSKRLRNKWIFKIFLCTQTLKNGRELFILPEWQKKNAQQIIRKLQIIAFISLLYKYLYFISVSKENRNPWKECALVCSTGLVDVFGQCSYFRDQLIASI